MINNLIMYQFKSCWRITIMDNVKYQVFLSSTYTDLINERKKVLDILLMADCIPAGMESFVATDDEQFNVIKRVIDLCDYYILIIGKRYGSINQNTGISYTEMEYNYAIDKGIPVLVFAIDDSVELDSEMVENDDVKKGKLAEFKSKAMTNRLANIWKDTSDLLGKVAISIMRAKAEIKRPGWHRGSDAEKENLKKQISDLKRQLEISKVENIQDSNESHLLEKRFYGVNISLHYTEKVYVFTSNTIINECDITTTLDQLFKFVSLRITGVKTANYFIEAISSYKDGYYVNEQDALVVRNKYEQLGLLESFNGKDNIEMIQLTELGRKVMNELNE